jgi:retron-type reverse transcriptase
MLILNSLRHDFKFLKVENLGNQLVQQKGNHKIEVSEKDMKKGVGALTTHIIVRFSFILC